MYKIIFIVCGMIGTSVYTNAVTIKTIQKNCEKGNLKSCNKVARMYEDGNGTKQDIIKAIHFYKKSCDADDLVGCYNLGLAYHEGKGVEQNITKAINIYKKACDKGDGFSCTNLGDIYINSKSVKQNPTKGISLYRQGCEFGNYVGCVNLGVMYYNGNYIKQNINKALNLFKKSCDNGNNDGCYNYTTITRPNYTMIHPTNFKDTKENREEVIQFIQIMVKDANPAQSATILRMLEKNQLSSFKILTRATNKKLLDKIINKECSKKSCSYTIVKMLYESEIRASKEKLSW